MDKFEGILTDAFLNKRISSIKIEGVFSDGTTKSLGSTNYLGEFSIKNYSDLFKIRFIHTNYIIKEINFPFNFITPIRLLEKKIIAYQDKMSYCPGSIVKVYVNSQDTFSAVLFRNKIENELAINLGIFPPKLQVVPDGYFVEEGLSWIPSFEYTIPDEAKPGLYTLKLASAVNEINIYNLSFIVSSVSKPKNRILYLTSTNNWQTYNIWGGRSRYRNFEHLSLKQKNDSLRQFWIKYIPDYIKDITKRVLRKKFPITINDAPSNFQFRKLSIKRPHPNCSIDSKSPHNPYTSHLAENTWRLISWLESKNMKYDIASGFDIHKNPEVLKNYNTIILSSHNEYWSKEMFMGLKDFFYTGGSILNLSGNSIYREIEFYEDGSLRCVSLNFSESVADETEIIGVRFTMKGYGTCAPYKVLDPNHWIYEGLNIKKGDIFGKQSLNRPIPENEKKFESNPASSPGLAKLTGEGASGWETDKLSSTAPKDIKVVAKGANKGSGGADMIVRDKTDKRGMLFSVSSITFAGSLLVDDVCSKIVENAIKKSLEN